MAHLMIIRLGIFLGFAAFFFMEKTLRVLGGDEGTNHSHSHSHAVPEEITATGVDLSSPENDIRKRSSGFDRNVEPKSSSNNQAVPSAAGGPSKLSAYLNLFGDFVHNM